MIHLLLGSALYDRLRPSMTSQHMIIRFII